MGLLHLCDEQPAKVRPEVSAAEAIHIMLDHRVGAVTIIDDSGVVAGIFTERDVLRKLVLSGRDPAKTPVSELMTVPVILATADTSPGEAFSIMMERHFRHLPIVDDAGASLPCSPSATSCSGAWTNSRTGWIRWSST